MVSMTFVVVLKHVEMEEDRGSLLLVTHSFEEAFDFCDDYYEVIKRSCHDLYTEILAG